MPLTDGQREAKRQRKQRGRDGDLLGEGAVNSDGEDENVTAAKARKKRRSGGKTKPARERPAQSTEVKLPAAGAMKADRAAAAQRAVTAEETAAVAAAHGDVAARYLAAAGHAAPTAVQAAVWPPGLAMRDVVAVAPPGAGKTVAYVVPVAAALSGKYRQGADTRPDGPLCLVLLPTRELASQVLGAFRPCRRLLGLRAVALLGGADRGDQADRLGREDPHVAVGTPGRLVDLARAGDLELQNVKCVVIDECDKMLGDGMGEQLAELRGILAERRAGGKGRAQVMLLTATMPEGVRAVAEDWCRRPARVEVGVDESLLSPTITQVVHVCAEHKKPKKLLKHLKARPTPPPGAPPRPRSARPLQLSRGGGRAPPPPYRDRSQIERRGASTSPGARRRAPPVTLRPTRPPAGGLPSRLRGPPPTPPARRASRTSTRGSACGRGCSSSRTGSRRCGSSRGRCPGPGTGPRACTGSGARGSGRRR